MYKIKVTNCPNALEQETFNGTFAESEAVKTINAACELFGFPKITAADLPGEPGATKIIGNSDFDIYQIEIYRNTDEELFSDLENL